MRGIGITIASVLMTIHCPGWNLFEPPVGQPYRGAVTCSWAVGAAMIPNLLPRSDGIIARKGR